MMYTIRVSDGVAKVIAKWKKSNPNLFKKYKKIYKELMAVQFKNGRSEYGIYVSVAVSILIFACIVERLTIFVDAIEEIRQYLNMNTVYLYTLLKMIGITYIAEFCSSICKDAGYQTISVQIEIFSKLTILVLGIPVLLTLLETIQDRKSVV